MMMYGRHIRICALKVPENMHVKQRDIIFSPTSWKNHFVQDFVKKIWHKLELDIHNACWVGRKLLIRPSERIQDIQLVERPFMYLANKSGGRSMKR
ncbi:hypothetical protein Syun_030894 [Stephania yunnanensis]|uniref:Uncharacterized protein n=1 Tax=Stephania yunnanensis TaxID=152371 RepID=A0AAP0HEG4_9MAGN